MATREQEGNVSMEASVLKPSNVSASLRRKSGLVHNAILLENNDEEERLALRREINISTPAQNIITNDRRRSLGLGFLAQMSAPEISNRICECIKLSTENKINVKNAFNLKMIDFMTYMIKKQDANMSSLQVASTSLDVSTKIYGFRVDGVHTELMKMVGGADKHDNEMSDGIQQGDPGCNTEENDANNLEKKRKKKKSKCRQQIFCTAESLKGVLETMTPSFWMMGDEDSQTTNELYQVMLPNHANSMFYLHLYKDVFVDSIEHPISNMDNKEVNILKLDFHELEICPSLSDFEFHNWTYDNEKEADKEEENDRVHSQENDGFHFDLDASVPKEDESIHDNVNFLDMQDEVNNAEEYIQPQKPVEKIVDFFKVVTDVGATKMSEYSFVQKSMNLHWAGPSHWKVNNFKRLLGTSKIIETCQQVPEKKRKEIELSYSDNVKTAIEAKFAPRKTTKTESKASMEWSEANITLPRDMHYNISSAAKLYLHELISISLENTDQLNTTQVSDDIEDYDYNNDNDTSNYCPNVPSDDYVINENGADFVFEDGEQEMHVFTGDNLVAVPKLTNKVAISYSTRAKRIDMRQLKKSIWKGLITNNNSENINIENATQQKTENKMNETKCFSEVYKVLPTMLTRTNIEALSFPISFVSLLHLANEKTLTIESLPDMSDITITAN